MNHRIGVTGLPASLASKLWGAALIAAVAAFGLKQVVHIQSSIISAVIVLGAFGLVYLGATIAMRVPESRVLLRRLRLVR